MLKHRCVPFVIPAKAGIQVNLKSCAVNLMDIAEYHAELDSRLRGNDGEIRGNGELC